MRRLRRAHVLGPSRPSLHLHLSPSARATNFSVLSEHRLAVSPRSLSSLYAGKRHEARYWG
ncbi:hypothetical protein BDZ89DRAFT_1074346 [Hymenopellis radicata]|nr:hypothetical protein BDZ89DRAFT_1074346 [Hymenopellis radicata]